MYVYITSYRAGIFTGWTLSLSLNQNCQSTEVNKSPANYSNK